MLRLLRYDLPLLGHRLVVFGIALWPIIGLAGLAALLNGASEASSVVLAIRVVGILSASVALFGMALMGACEGTRRKGWA